MHVQTSGAGDLLGRIVVGIRVASRRHLLFLRATPINLSACGTVETIYVQSAPPECLAVARFLTTYNTPRLKIR